MPSTGKRRYLLLAISLLITGVFVAWFVSKQDWPKIGRAFRTASPLYIFLSVPPMMIAYIFRVLRWKILMLPVKRLSFGQLLGATLIGFTANNLLPLRAGEFVRPAVVKARYGTSFTSTLATIAVERLFDLLALSVVLVFVCVFWPIPAETPDAPQQSISHEVVEPAEAAPSTSETGPDRLRTFNAAKAGAFLAVMIAVLTGALLVLKHYPETVKAVASWTMRFLPHTFQSKVLGLIDSFVVGLRFMEQLHHVLLCVLYSLGLWASVGWSMLFSAHAFGMAVSYPGACFSLLCVAVAVAMPQGPGFVGTFHYFAQASMQSLGNPAAPAAGYAILAHAIAVVPVCIGGFISLWIMGLSFGQIKRQAAGADETAQEDDQPSTDES